MQLQNRKCDRDLGRSATYSKACELSCKCIYAFELFHPLSQGSHYILCGGLTQSNCLVEIKLCMVLKRIYGMSLLFSPALRQSFVYSSCNYSLVTVHGFYKTRFVHFYSALQSYSSSARKDGECLGKLSFKFGHQFFGLDFNQNCDLAILKYAFAWI